MQIRRNIYVLNNSTQASLFLSWNSSIYKCFWSTWQSHICPHVIPALHSLPLYPLSSSFHFHFEEVGKKILEEETRSFLEKQNRNSFMRERREWKHFCIILLRLRQHAISFFGLNAPKVFASKKRDERKNEHLFSVFWIFFFSPEMRSRKLRLLILWFSNHNCGCNDPNSFY